MHAPVYEHRTLDLPGLQPWIMEANGIMSVYVFTVFLASMPSHVRAGDPRLETML